MEERTVNISLTQYDAFCEMRGRLMAFKEYIEATKYDPDRKVCAAILGFDYEEKEDEGRGHYGV